jgi:hypothetical protein
MRNRLISAVAVALGLLGLVGLAHAGGEVCEGAAPCAPKKVCAPSTDKVTIPRTSWGMVCEDFCVPPCCWFHGLFHGKGCCGDKEVCCGKLKKRRILVIKVRKEERTIPVCVPTEVPEACAAACPATCEVSIGAPQVCPGGGPVPPPPPGPGATLPHGPPPGSLPVTPAVPPTPLPGVLPYPR